MQKIIKQLENICDMGYNRYNVFSDWVDLMVFALMRDDEHYLPVIQRYNNERPVGHRPADYFANALGLLLYETNLRQEDVLGQVYMLMELGNEHVGQFFTPPSLTRLMVQMLKPSSGTINDPCCGSGSMLIESCKVMSLKEIDESFFTGTDISNICFKMTALNLLFFNLNGMVIWGNTISLEYWNAIVTKRTALGGSFRFLLEEEMEQHRPKLKKII